MLRRFFLKKITSASLGLIKRGKEQVQKPILNVFLAGDFSQASRSADRNFDLLAMESFFKECALAAGMEIRLQKFVNARFSSNVLLDAITKLGNIMTNQPPNSGIAVYYSGHGANYGAETYPNLAFSDKDTLLMSELCRVVGVCKPRLRFVLADCCNNFVKEKLFAPTITREIAKDNKEFIRKLFWNFDNPQVCRSVLICAAERGDYSVSVSSGSVFQQLFRKAFILSSNENTEATWTVVKKRTLLEMTTFFENHRTTLGNEYMQTPVFTILDTKR